MPGWRIYYGSRRSNQSKGMFIQARAGHGSSVGRPRSVTDEQGGTTMVGSNYRGLSECCWQRSRRNRGFRVTRVIGWLVLNRIHTPNKRGEKRWPTGSESVEAGGATVSHQRLAALTDAMSERRILERWPYDILRISDLRLVETLRLKQKFRTAKEGKL
mmetsp:Transcript_7138/g.14679  ORF Transcript_7138/g.14679 Transcript_7138/m.14679 type:complete len:159 (+) Transcript_7138:135-611(+)